MYQRVRFPSSNSSVAVREHEATGHRDTDVLQSQTKSTDQNLEGDQLQSQACSSTADRRDKQALATSEAAKITDVRASVDALVGRVWRVYGAGPSRGSSAAESLVERAGAWDNVSFLKGGGVMGDDDLERPPPKAHSAPEIVAPTNRANVALPVGNITIEE